MGFQKFGLLSSLIHSLKEQNIKTPTEIQELSIPLLLKGDSLVGVAQTGSGKTLAYALPILHQLKTQETEGSPVENPAQPRALVLVPTRELGEQVAKVFKTLTHLTRLRVRPALGGMTFEQARRNVSGPFEILLATPERLIQLLKGEYIDLSQVQILIFDEADQMLDQGFMPSSQFILKACPPIVQKALFSATVSNTVQELINETFEDARILRTATSGKVVDTLKTKNLKVKNGQRWPLLESLLKENKKTPMLIFTNTREQCDELAEHMKEKGFPCEVYRGEMEPVERRKNLKAFRDGKIKVLVCTDLAARGLDIANVEIVINYHLPRQMENYLHRAGRTARGGKSGLVINLLTERDERIAAKLEKRKEVPLKEIFAKSKQNFKNEKQIASNSKNRKLNAQKAAAKSKSSSKTSR